MSLLSSFGRQAIPVWVWVAIGATGLATAGGMELASRHQARNEGRAEVQAKWDAAVAAATLATLERERELAQFAARAETQRIADRADQQAAAAGRADRVTHEIATDPVFTDCRVPDRVRVDLGAAIRSANRAARPAARVPSASAAR